MAQVFVKTVKNLVVLETHTSFVLLIVVTKPQLQAIIQVY
jgi:hypothetical protein